jgi:diacylglycerol kinase family enzyme
MEGTMRYKIAILILLLSVSLFSQQRGIGLGESGGQSLQSFYQESWAIVIGIDNYLKAPKLRYAVKDARGVAQILVENYGFKKENVIELYDQQATKEGIMRAFDRIRQKADKEDRVFVFFAGHGITVQLPDGREKGYILPYDGSQSELIASAISTDQLNEISQLIRAKHLFFVMDACYGGLIFARAQPITAEAVEYVKVITTRRARKALTAGGRDQTVFDTGPGGHSVFTYYFIDALQNMGADLNSDGIITTYELNEYIAPRVTAETGRSQTPEYGILAGDMGGDFVFIPAEAIVLEMDVGIESNPDFADVKIDGNYAGKTPLNLKLKPGKYKVEISKPGYVKMEEFIEVEREGDNRFSFSLSEFYVNLNIASNLNDGEVYVDDMKVGQLVNGKMSLRVKPGERVIKVEGREESGQVKVNIPEIESFDVFVEAVLKPGKLTVQSNVDDADVFINGVNYGKTKNKIAIVDLKPGRYTVKLVKPKYYEKSKEVQIIAGSEQSVVINLYRMFSDVKLKVKPEDAKVYANDKYIGSGAEFRSEIEKGNVKFRVEREGYETIEKVYTVNQDEMEFNFELVPIVATIRIETEPAEAIVIANGNKIGVTPVSFKLKYGSYDIEVMKPGYKRQIIKVDVRRSEAIVRKIKLEETAETKAMKIYRSRLSLKNNLTYTGAGLTLVSAGVAVAFHIKSEDAYSKYQSAVEVEKMRMYKNDYKKFVTLRNISIGVGVVFGALTVYNALRKVSYEEIYQKVRENKLSFEMRDYNYVGFVPVLSLKLRI